MTESAEEPKTLYHYTTPSGLLGIVRTRAVWASNIGYLNDSREYRYAVELFSDALESSGIDLTLVPEFQAFSKKSRLFNTFSFPSIFVFSMTEHDDGLNLWRAYCKGDSGYAIGLRTNELIEIANNQDFELVKCSYDKAEHVTLIRQFTNELGEWCEKELTKQQAMLAQQRYKFHMYFYPKFGVLAARIKHPSFVEESEWRLVSKIFSGTQHKVETRAVSSTLVPYVEIKLPKADDTLPIDCLTVGPTIDPARAVHSARVLLEVKNKNFIKVSEVPYRFW